MKTLKEVLIGAKDILSDPNKWCKGASAVNSNGYAVEALQHDACKFCMLGAIEKASDIKGFNAQKLCRVG